MSFRRVTTPPYEMIREESYEYRHDHGKPQSRRTDCTGGGRAGPMAPPRREPSSTVSTLPEMAIERCRQCDADGWGVCRARGSCVIEDDFAGLVERMREADAIVFATPVYFSDLSESLRAILDRLPTHWPARGREAEHCREADRMHLPWPAGVAEARRCAPAASRASPATWVYIWWIRCSCAGRIWK